MILPLTATPRHFHCASDAWQRFELCRRRSDFTSLPPQQAASAPGTIMTFPLRKSVSGRRMLSPIPLCARLSAFLRRILAVLLPMLSTWIGSGAVRGPGSLLDRLCSRIVTFRPHYLTRSRLIIVTCFTLHFNFNVAFLIYSSLCWSD